MVPAAVAPEAGAEDGALAGPGPGSAGDDATATGTAAGARPRPYSTVYAAH
ncbi:hypothetical protein ACFQ9X_55355 [Catenulispora yoronensis]